MKFDYFLVLVIALIYVSPALGYWSIVSSPLNWILRNIPGFSNSGFTEAARVLANITNHGTVERRSSASNRTIYIVSGPYEILKDGVRLPENSSKSVVFNTGEHEYANSSGEYLASETRTVMPSSNSTLTDVTTELETLLLETNSSEFTTESVVRFEDNETYEQNYTNLVEAEVFYENEPEHGTELYDVDTVDFEGHEPTLTELNDTRTANATETDHDELLLRSETELSTTATSSTNDEAVAIYDVSNHLIDDIDRKTYIDDNDEDPWLGYFDVVRANDLQNCLSLMVCETSAEPELYEEYGHRVSKFFRKYTPKENNRAAWWYKNAALLGHEYKSTRVCRDNFPFCNIDTRHIVMFMEVPM